MQGKRFIFDKRGVSVLAPHPSYPYGAVEMRGVWTGDGLGYTLVMVPLGTTNGVKVTAVHQPGPSQEAPHESCELVGSEMTRFFNALMIDLSGAELSFSNLNVTKTSNEISR